MGSVGGWVFVLDFTWSVGNFISSAVGRGGGEILLGWAHINVRSPRYLILRRVVLIKNKEFEARSLF